MIPDSRSDAVVYARADYAGFWRRLAAAGIDLVVIVALSEALLPISDVTVPRALRQLTLLLVSFVYVGVFKWLPISTLGYRVCRLRIVNHHGERPGLLWLAFRLLGTLSLWTALGPVDYLWGFNDPCRQTLHDKWAQTYVVKVNAMPVGRGRVIYSSLDVQTLSFIFPEIRVDG